MTTSETVIQKKLGEMIWLHVETQTHVCLPIGYEIETLKAHVK